MERCVAIDTISGSGRLWAVLHACMQPLSNSTWFSTGQLCLPSTYNEYLRPQAPAEILKPSLVTVISLGSVSNYTFLAACPRSSLLVYNIEIAENHKAAEGTYPPPGMVQIAMWLFLT